MIKILFISFIFIFSFSSWSRVILDLSFTTPTVTQGELVNAKLLMGADGIQKLEIQKLKGITLGETVYVYDVSPVIKTGDKFEADVKIIFASVPTSKFIIHKLSEEEVQLNFPEVSIIATESLPQFVYEDFSIPARPKYLVWLLVVLVILVGVIFGRKFYQKAKRRNLKKKKRLALKNELLIANDYETIVTVWMMRANYLAEFPQIEAAFRKFEAILFKYQFKPTQTDEEKQKVVSAYEVFRSEVSGGLDGV